MHTARWTLPTYILAIFLPNCQMVVIHRYCHSYAYGLKQVSLEFHNTMVELLTAADGYLATSDPCLFTKQDGVDISIVAVHVDDLMMLSTSDAEQRLKRLDAHLVECWERSNGNKLSRQRGPTILSMVIQEMDDGSIFVSQPVYAMTLSEIGVSSMALSMCLILPT